jgi:hypothetical protein
MKTTLIVFALVVFFCFRPDTLYSFDTVPGRTILLAGVIYLVQLNPLLGLLGALALSRVMDRSPVIPLLRSPPDLLQMQSLMQSKCSNCVPFMRTAHVPTNDDAFFNYTWF